LRCEQTRSEGKQSHAAVALDAALNGEFARDKPYPKEEKDIHAVWIQTLGVMM